MFRMCAQGDILIERLDDAPVTGEVLAAVEKGPVIVAEGEGTGHRHQLVGCVTLYRDDALARDIPDNLYVGHLRIEDHAARLEHDEHAPIVLEHGTYRVRRQRRLEPDDVAIHED